MIAALSWGAASGFPAAGLFGAMGLRGVRNFFGRKLCGAISGISGFPGSFAGNVRCNERPATGNFAGRLIVPCGLADLGAVLAAAWEALESYTLKSSLRARQAPPRSPTREPKA